MMKWKHTALAAALGLGMLLAVAGEVRAQNATVTLGSQKQSIRGFGGMAHATWIGDMTAAERILAFGNGDGQFVFTILRIPVSDGNPDALNVATAKGSACRWCDCLCGALECCWNVRRAPVSCVCDASEQLRHLHEGPGRGSVLHQRAERT